MKLKTFTIDWDNYDEVSSLGCKIKSRLGEINPNRISKNDKIRISIDRCQKIFNCDITQVYSDLHLDKNPIYYVYAHLDPTKKIAIGVNGKTTFAATLGMDCFPFYIGKGTGDRCFNLNRNETHRKIKQKIESLGKEVKIIKLIESLTEIEALCFESKLIDIFGLIPHKGYLSNLDEGINKDMRRLIYRQEFEKLTGINRIL